MDNSPKIEIYVSHRIDLNSQLVNNPLYKNMRCGAVFDDKNPMNIAGDDTGDNISERRMSFCEFTVQYWAWKNSDADYIGLCHYRRYLSFAEKRYKTNAFTMVDAELLDGHTLRKHGLMDKERMSQVISQYDIITSEYADVKKIPTPRGKQNNVRDMWKAHENVFFENGALEILLGLIDKYSPEYSISAREYLSGNKHRGFNCFIMKQDFFRRLCEFQFPIMFEAERLLDFSEYTQTMRRTPAFFGEIMYGIFIYHEEKNGTARIKELQLIFFRDSDHIKGTADMLWRNIKTRLALVPRALINPFFPIGSARREWLKNIYYAVTRKERRGPAQITEDKQCKRK